MPSSSGCCLSDASDSTADSSADTPAPEPQPPALGGWDPFWIGVTATALVVAAILALWSVSGPS